MNTTTLALRSNRSRFNPLTHITPDSLARQLDAFESGYLREAVNTWDLIEKRDDILKTVIPKRKKSVSRNGWEVVPVPHLLPEQRAEAAAHQAALEHFYRHLTCTNAIDANERGGFKLLVRQMMDSVGKRYAVHEIVWKPDPKNGLTAEFRFVPLSFFENTTGQLRFLETDTALEGHPLEPGAWLVTTGEGLMIASSLAWMIKNLTLKDWLLFVERHATPGLRGVTTAARDSDDWNALLDTINKLLCEGAVVTTATEDIQVLDLAKGDAIPFPTLADRMDRTMAILWRGSDLSTLSREHGVGASLQDGEASILEQDDCELISETLNACVDNWIIRYLFGENVLPLARIRLLTSPRESSPYDLQIDQFLLNSGAPLSVQDTLDRYGRPHPAPGDPILQPNKPTTTSGLGRTGALACPVWAPRPNDPTTPDSNLKSEISNSKSADTPGSAAFQAAPAGILPAVPPTLDIGLSTLDSSSPFQLLQGDWIQISPLGDFPHGQGIQRVDAESLAALTRQFNSLFARLGRLFVGVPFYIGHPDVPELAREYPDRKAYGWITALEARDTGLVAKVKWSDDGKNLLEQAHYKFLSPYWEADQIATENGRKIFRPKRLLSVGLTNQPNIPVLPLANDIDLGRTGAPADSAGSAAFQAAPAGILPAVPPTLDFRLSTLDSHPLHTQSLTNNLGSRHSQRVCASARQSQIQKLITEKLALGNTYDQAWSALKSQHPALFNQMSQPLSSQSLVPTLG